MRFEPSEKVMYRRMDCIEKLRYLIIACIVLSIASALFGAITNSWLLAGSCLLVFISILTCLGLCYGKVKQSVMPLTGCYLEVQMNLIRIRQPYHFQDYEAGRIYLNEVVSLIKGEKEGGFYICIGTGGKSGLYCDKMMTGSCIFVSPIGYGEEEMECVYQAIKEQIPASSAVYEA